MASQYNDINIYSRIISVSGLMPLTRKSEERAIKQVSCNYKFILTIVNFTATQLS